MSGALEGGKKVEGKDSRHLSSSPLSSMPDIEVGGTAKAGTSVGAICTAEKCPRTIERPEKLHVSMNDSVVVKSTYGLRGTKYRPARPGLPGIR